MPVIGGAALWALALRRPAGPGLFVAEHGWCAQPGPRTWECGTSTGSRAWSGSRAVHPGSSRFHSAVALDSRIARHATASAPRELVDLFGMRTRELKAFLQGKGIYVDDCFDADSLIERAAATETEWAPIAPVPVPAAATPVATAPRPIPSASDAEAAWRKVCQAWPAGDPLEYGPLDARMSVILLHGFGDSGARYLSETLSLLTRIDGLRLILPQAPQETLQGQRLTSWFLPTNGQWIVDDTVAKPIVAYLHAMVRREVARGVQPNLIVVGGFAQGGSCAARAALSFPDAPLGGALLLSSFFGSASASVASVNKGLRVLVCHGRDDEIVPFTEGERTAAVLRDLLKGEEVVTFKAYDMKHGVATDEVMDLFEFLDARMKAVQEQALEPAQEGPLAFDPIKMTPPPPVAAPSPRTPPLPGDAGVPSMDPAVVLELLNDPEIVEPVKDPEAMAVIQDVMMNPESLDQHKGNPRVGRLIDKVARIVNRGSAPFAD